MRATLRQADGVEEICEASYLAGRDGAHSTVREALAIGFPGGTYVADVEGSGPATNGEIHVGVFCLTPRKDIVGFQAIEERVFSIRLSKPLGAARFLQGLTGDLVHEKH